MRYEGKGVRVRDEGMGVRVKSRNNQVGWC